MPVDSRLKRYGVLVWGLIFRSRIVRILSALIFIFFLLDFIFPLPPMKPFSQAVYAADGTLLHAFLASDQKWRLQTRLEDVSPVLIKSIMGKEDKWFYYHPGFNPVSFARALFDNIVNWKTVSGGSTITMQLARLLDPSERTVLTKIKELFRAVQLEWHYGKDEILEAYLSYLPYGGNVEGVSTASYFYCNRDPDRLSLAQSVLLSVIPNNPNALRPDRHPEKARAFRDLWLNHFRETAAFSEADITDAIDEDVPSERYALPRNAPHFSIHTASVNKTPIIKTTIETNIQQSADRLLASYVRRVSGRGIKNGAVLVIDNRSGAIVAYCGSSDFYDTTSSGEVNGVIAVRSPGSALKPAVYGLAFDQGFLTPSTMVSDVPTEFNGYVPENFSYTFQGWISAGDALMKSLNLPAVLILQKAGVKEFIDLLERANFRSISKNKDSFGLSLILGGCGVTLYEMTSLYTAFARNGVLYKPHYLAEDTVRGEGIRLFSEAASFLLADVLSQNARPDFPRDLLEHTELPKIAWKTGTSFGRRDAWTIGFNTHYTIGVWMGNFDAKGSPTLSGIEAAVPLLFELFSAIDYGDKEWFSKPESVLEREVCVLSGMQATVKCEKTKKAYYIDRVSTQTPCSMEQEIFVNESRTMRYCRECLPESGYIKVVYPDYPPAVTLFFQSQKENAFEIPPHNPECQAFFGGKGPVIQSPQNKSEYLLEEGGGQEIALLAASDAKVDYHLWYVGDTFIGKAKVNEKLFFKPAEGEQTITCVDNMGRQAKSHIVIKFY